MSGFSLYAAAWRAPETFEEQDGKQEVSFKTDVYMFGCVILEVVTCTTPFYWLPSAESVVMRARAGLLNPYEAAVVENKLTSAMADSPARASLLLLAQWCMKHAPADRPDLEGVMRCLDDIRGDRVVIETETQLRDVYDSDTVLLAPIQQDEVRAFRGACMFSLIKHGLCMYLFVCMCSYMYVGTHRLVGCCALRSDGCWH